MRTRPYELVARLVPTDGRAQRRDRECRTRLRRALQREQRRADEQLAADERRDGIPGQTEDERAVTDAERQRFARLHGNAPEHLLDAELGLDAPDQVVWSDGNAAGGDEHGRLEPELERRAMRLLVVGDGG